MIGETSKLTLIIPPKREREAHICAIALQQLSFGWPKLA